jgi:DnaJ-class molecular chaperone
MKRLPCKRCKGTGQIMDYSDEAYKSGKLDKMILKDCPDCDGRGWYEVHGKGK